MGRKYIVEVVEEKSDNRGCGSILLGIIAVGILILVGVVDGDEKPENSSSIQQETSAETCVENYKTYEETSVEQLSHTNSHKEEERVEAYEELRGDEIPLNEQVTEDSEEDEDVATEYVEGQITSKEQRKAERKERREARRKTKQK